MEMNKGMRNRLEETGIQMPGGFEPLHPVLKQIAASDLIEVEGCLFLKALFHEDYDIHSALEGDDKTGLECSLNNLYIQSIIYINPYKEVVNEKYVLNQGILYANYLAAMLRPHGHFRIVLSCPIEKEPEIMVDCSVRFHLVRHGENWITGNIEEYTEEAILVLDTHENQM